MAWRPFPGRNIFTFHCSVSTLQFCSCSFQFTLLGHVSLLPQSHGTARDQGAATRVSHIQAQPPEFAIALKQLPTTMLSHSQFFFSRTYSCKVRLLISMQRFHILKRSSHPCVPWRRLPTQHASCLKAYPCASLVCCLARKWFCLPLLKGHQCYSSAARAAIIPAERKKTSPFEDTNCRKALGWEEKIRGKNSQVPKGYSYSLIHRERSC